MKRRIWSIFTALALCLGICPGWGRAAPETERGGEPDSHYAVQPDTAAPVNAPALCTSADNGGTDVATVNTGSGEVASCTSLEEAFQKAQKAEKATITLCKDVTLSEMLKVNSGDITFEGGNFKVTSATDSATIRVDSGCKLTVKSGTIENTNSSGVALGIIGGEVSLHDGTVIADCDAIYVKSGNLTVMSGTIQAESGDALYIGRDGEVSLRGGTFIGKINSYSKPVADALAEGFVFYKNENGTKTLCELTPSLKMLPNATYTVEECTHPENERKLADLGNGYHAMSCSVCGFVMGELVPHKMENGVCECGARQVAKVTIDGGEPQFYSDARAAWEAACEHTAAIHFLRNVGAEDNPVDLRNVSLSGNVTITAESSCTVYWDLSVTLDSERSDGERSDGELTIGSGKFVGTVDVSGFASLHITEGANLFSGDGKVVCVNATGRAFSMDGGTITYSGNSSKSSALHYSGENAQLTGGTLDGGSAGMAIDSPGCEVMELLEVGYAYYQNSAFMSNVTGASITGKVEILECTSHDYSTDKKDLGDDTHAKQCQYCRTPENPETHRFQDGQCTVCGGWLTAKLTAEGADALHTSAEGAWRAAQGKKAVIEILEDQEPKRSLEMNDPESDITVTVAEGKTLSKDDHNLFNVSGGSLRLHGGHFAGNSAVYINGGRLTVDGETALTGYRIIYAYGGEINISGSPTLIAAQDEALWLGGTCTVRLDGGTFKGGNSPYSEGTIFAGNGQGTAAGLLSNGYAAGGNAYFNVDENGEIIQAVPDPFQESLSGRVTVRPIGFTAETAGGETRYDTPYTLRAVVSPADMDEGYAYQWYKGDEKIEGAREASYAVPARSINVGETGEFRCWIFHPDKGALWSRAAVRTVPAPITEAAVTLAPSTFPYDGKAHRPGIAGVTLGGVTLEEGTDFTAEIPEETAEGRYAVTVTGRGNYTGTATAWFAIHPVEYRPVDKEDGGGNDLRLEIASGLSSVPEALRGDERYDTPEKIERALRLRVSAALSHAGAGAAVFDVKLQYQDEAGEWHAVDPDNFPKEGVQAILPFPPGTNGSGYTFTVQHLISSGERAGEMETLEYSVQSTGLQCRFFSLSPVAIGYQAVNSAPSGGGGSSKPSIVYRPDGAQGGCGGGTGCPSHRFEDLDAGAWYHEAVDFVVRGGLMNGFSGTRFGPDAPLSRAQLAQILYNIEGMPPVSDGGGVFADVTGGVWFAPAVAWAAENGIVDGYGNGLFGPDDNITREQLAVMLWRYAGRPEATISELPFADAGQVSHYAVDAMRWAVEKGVVTGKGGGILDPQGLATRAQTAQMLLNFM